MDAAVAGLIGAGIGAFSALSTTTVSTIVTNRSAERRHRLELQDARASRLLERRWEAHLALFSELESAHLRYEFRTDPLDEEQTRDGSVAALTAYGALFQPVQLMSSTSLCEKADRAIVAAVEYEFGPVEGEGMIANSAHYVETLQAYQAAVQREIGVD